MESIRSARKLFWKSIFHLNRIEIFLTENVHRKAIPHQPKGKQVWQVETDKIMAQFQCLPLRQDRWLLVVQYRWNYTRIMWSDSKDSKCRNLQFDKFPTPASFLVWKTRFKTQVMMWIKRSGELKSSRSVSGKDFPDFEMLDAKIASAVNKIIQNSQFKKEDQPRGADSTERGPVPERETNRLHDLRLLSSDCCSWHSVRLYLFYSRLLFALTTFRNSIRDGTKFCYRRQKIHPMNYGRVCTN